MNQVATTTTTAPAKPARKPKVAMALKLGAITPELRRQGAAVLEVLAGVRSPTEAAKDLALSIPAYYKLESRAVRGLILACRAPGKGPKPAPEVEANRLAKQCRHLQQDLQRYQALARTAQRAAGLPAPPPVTHKDAKGRRKRKPAVRALKALAALKETPEAAGPTASVPLSGPPAAVASPVPPVATGATSVR